MYFILYLDAGCAVQENRFFKYLLIASVYHFETRLL